MKKYSKPELFKPSQKDLERIGNTIEKHYQIKKL